MVLISSLTSTRFFVYVVTQEAKVVGMTSGLKEAQKHQEKVTKVCFSRLILVDVCDLLLLQMMCEVKGKCSLASDHGSQLQTVK